MVTSELHRRNLGEQMSRVKLKEGVFTKFVGVRMAQDDVDAIDALAATAGVDRATYIRAVTLDHLAESKAS
jgi:predicted DNA binding CopG/RHH family protein